MTKIEQLQTLGFTTIKLSKKWYLISLYSTIANSLYKRILSHLIFVPINLSKEKENKL